MILFIDDEEARTRPWVDQLKDDGREIKVLTSADEARRTLEAPIPDIECIILDLMIPADGEVPDSETGYGTRTGLWLLQTLRANDSATPAIVLSNVDDPSVEEAATRLGANYQRKRSCRPAKLAKLVRELVTDDG